jgi:hypothetical protein
VGGGRRCRLVCFCLQFLEFGEHKLQSAAAIASACLAALVRGSSISPLSVFGERFSDTVSSGYAFCQHLSGASLTPIDPMKSMDAMDEIFGRLWSPPLDRVERLLSPSLHHDPCDFVRLSCQKVYSRSVYVERNKPATALHPLQSEVVLDTVIDILDNAITRAMDSESIGEKDEINSIGVSYTALSRSIVFLKSYMLIVYDNIKMDDESKSLSVCASEIFKRSCSVIPALDQNPDEKITLLSGLVSMVRGLTFAYMSFDRRWPRRLLLQASSLYDTCESMLNDLKSSGGVRNKLVTSMPANSANDMLFDDERLDRENDHSDRPKRGSMGLKRKRQESGSRRQPSFFTTSQNAYLAMRRLEKRQRLNSRSMSWEASVLSDLSLQSKYSLFLRSTMHQRNCTAGQAKSRLYFWCASLLGQFDWRASLRINITCLGARFVLILFRFATALVGVPA